jgi:putative ABC transport system permease protein
MGSCISDVRFSVRGILRSPGTTAAVVIALALGVGATSAVFSVVNAVLLQPFPYKQPERLVMVWEQRKGPEAGLMFASPPNYADWRDQNQVFSNIAAFRPTRLFIGGDEASLRVGAARVTSGLLPMLGVTPMIGRSFTPEEDRPDAEQVVLLSHRIWQSHFAGDPEVVGRTILLNEKRASVVGVMPPEFGFPPPMIEQGVPAAFVADLWIPWAKDMRDDHRQKHYLFVIARLRDGVNHDRARDEMATIAARLAEQYPDTNAAWSATVVPFSEQVLGSSRAQLLTLLGAVAFVLLIACVNVANLLLARGTARQHELAIRSALGAGRSRLMRLLLIESQLLALMGGAAGLVVAYGGVGILTELAPDNVPRIEQVGIDPWVLAFTLVVSMLTGLLFGLAPALQGLSTGISHRLIEGGRTSSEGRGRGRLRSLLVVAQIALSLILLVGAGLLLQSLHNLGKVETGFDSVNILTLRTTLIAARYPSKSEQIAIDALNQIESRVNALPEVKSAGFIYDVPLGGDRQGTSITVEGEPEPQPGEELAVNFTYVTPGYFEAIGVPLLRGRAFATSDGAEAENVIIINQVLAQRIFPNQNPIGKRIFAVSDEPRRIIGVVGGVRHESLRVAPSPVAYLPFSQTPWSRTMSLVVRSHTPATEMVPAVKEQMRQVDPSLPVFDVKTIGQVIGESEAPLRFSTVLLAVFAGTALLLAAIGVLGVMSYTVSQRRHETSIRLALGAEPSDILKLMLGQGASLALTGVVAGLAVALALSRLLENLLFGVTAFDIVTLVGVSLLLIGVALLACYLPARRATKVDPQVVLRYE